MRLQFQPRKHLVTIGLMTLALSFVVCLAVTAENLTTVLSTWGESLQINAYLSDEAKEQDIQSIRDFISQQPSVEKYDLISKEKAIETFKEQMGNYAPELFQDPELIKSVPMSVEISLKSNLSAESHLSAIGSLAELLARLPGIEEVSYGKEWVTTYSKIITTSNSIMGLLAVVILIGALFIVANSIRSSINSRREEVEILELLGADRTFIRLPFITEGFYLGLISSAVATLLSYFAFSALTERMQSQIQFAQMSLLINFLSPQKIMIFILAAGALSALTSFICLREINTGWAASQRLRKS